MTGSDGLSQGGFVGTLTSTASLMPVVFGSLVAGILLAAAPAARATICIVPDNGTGTVDMPPNCTEGYVSPDDAHEIINGLPPDTTIQIGAEHMEFGLYNSGPGGSLGGEFEQFHSQLQLQLTGTGDLAGFQRMIGLQVDCETHIGPRTLGDPVQDFDTDMFQLSGEIFGDPDFDLLRITAGTNFGLPSPGHTTLTRQGLPGSDFAVDSFFDITYQIEFQGAPGSVLEGMSGITTGTIRMQLGSDDCGPTPDGSACEPVVCIPTTDACQPTCINFDPSTGRTTVLNCECRDPSECHVDLLGTEPGDGLRGDPCEVVDNGSGTVTLPPIGCDYLSPEEFHVIIDGLPTGTTIEMAPIHKDFICYRDSGTVEPTWCPPGGFCEEPGGTLGGNRDCFLSELSLSADFKNPDGTVYHHRDLVISGVACTVDTAPRTPGDPVQSFDTEMFRLEGEIFGDPDFDLLRVTAGSDLGLPSPGHTTLTQLPSGNFAVDSFFDITYQIDFVGAPGGVLDGMSGTTTATLRMETGFPDQPACIGGCPPGYECAETITQQPDGTLDICCDCVPTDCGPTADGLDCLPVDCPDANDECLPACAHYDFDTGETTVLDCDCRGRDECHVEIAGETGGPRGDPCVVVDNGSGTVTLPPDGCEYLSPDEVHMIIEGLPPDTTIELAPIHKDFICYEQQFCTLPIPPGDCEVPGGSLGGHGDCFDSILQLQMTGTGALLGFARNVSVQAFCEVHTGPRNPGDPVQDFPTDMFRLQGEIFGDPDFDLLRITAGTNFGLPSPGQTTLTRLGPPGSSFAVDSFFDITYQIEFVGAPGSVLEGFSGTTTGTLRMETGFPQVPSCVGGCPEGGQCIETVISNPDGTIEVCCDCICECPGDMNGDGQIDGLDIQGFVDCFLGVNTNPTVYCKCGDINGDGLQDFEDQDLFIELLLAGSADCDEVVELNAAGAPGGDDVYCNYEVKSVDAHPHTSCPAGWTADLPGSLQCIKCTTSPFCPGELGKFIRYRFVDSRCDGWMKRTGTNLCDECLPGYNKVAEFAP